MTAQPSDPPTYMDDQGRLWKKNPSNRLTLVQEDAVEAGDIEADDVPADEPDAQAQDEFDFDLIPSADDDPLGNPLAGEDDEPQSDDDPDSVG